MTTPWMTLKLRNKEYTKHLSSDAKGHSDTIQLDINITKGKSKNKNIKIFMLMRFLIFEAHV